MIEIKPDSLALSTKDMRIEFKTGADGLGLGRFTAIANAFDVVDSYGDKTIFGAFAASIKARPIVPLLWAHDPSQPLGLARNLRETARGLEFDGSIILAVAKGAEAWALLQGVGGASALKFSIGYEAMLTSVE